MIAKNDNKALESKPEGIAARMKRLAGIVLCDADLQGVVDAWPTMSEEARHICKVLADLVED